MKKCLIASLVMMILLLLPGTAWAIYTPPGKPEPSQVDIAEAQRVINGLKWDLSQASKGIIKLTIPKMNKNYYITINRDIGKYVGIGVDWKQVYHNYYSNGEGKILTFNSVNKATGFYIDIASKVTARVLALELYIYTPGQGVKYIPPQDRKYAKVDEHGNIISWLNVEMKPINEDGSLINHEPKESTPIELPFKDIKGHWAVADIINLSDTGYIKGYPGRSFRPEYTITKAEYMVILGRILKSKYLEDKLYQKETAPLALFKDFDSKHWSYQEVSDTLQYIPSSDINNIFKDEFQPDKPITREEVVAVLTSVLAEHKNFQANTAELVLNDTDTSAFPDSIRFLLRYNLVKGYPDQTFKPKNTITRAEIAAVMTRMLGKL